MARVINDLIVKMQEPLGLDRWSLRVVVGTLEDLAACEAEPEYKKATLWFDTEKFDTGDEPDEVVAHEMAHCHTAPIHDLALKLAACAAALLPEAVRQPIQAGFEEWARLAGEDATTQVGFTYIRLLRRLWKAEGEIASLRAEVRSLKKAAATAHP